MKKTYFSLRFFLFWFAFSAILTFFSVSKYLSLHTHFWDMGMYQNFLWNYSFKNLSNIFILYPHFRPVLSIYAVIYKLFPYGEVLLILQSLSISIAIFPLYAYAKDVLEEDTARIVVFLYCLFAPVWFINLSDFHPDSLIIPLSFLALYSLRIKKWGLFVVSIFLLLTVKEISFFITALIGIYAALRYRYIVLGYSMFILMSLSGVLVVDKLIPYFIEKTPIEVTGVSWLGDGMVGLIKGILLNPHSILAILINYWKIVYIIVLFGSFLFIPFLAPLELLPTIPGISLALLSDLWRHYALLYQYPSTVVSFVFIAFIEGLGKTKLSKTNILKTVVVVFIAVNFLYLGFLLFYKNDSYHFSRYIVTSRDNKIRTAIKRYIPADTSLSISTSNLINHSHLANRKYYLKFPDGVTRPYKDTAFADYVVIDLKRIEELRDILQSRGRQNIKDVEKKFYQIEKEIKNAFLRYEVVYEYDKFYILKSSENL